MVSTIRAAAAVEKDTEATAAGEYPLIAANKFEAALARISRVHERFSQELGSIAESLGAEASLADKCAALASELPLGIEAIGGGIKDIARALSSVDELVEAGRAGLSAVVSGVKDQIAGLEERTAGMRDITEFGAEVSEGASRIAEIADENRLIAINASVSASKAGDRVKGFKVIASEISRLSSAMAIRAPDVVRSAAQVDVRMDQIMAGMDGSIASTRRALASIDEAFDRLNLITASVRDASEGAAAMLGENSALAEGGRTIDLALGAIRDAIGRSRDGAATLSALMDGQKDAISGLATRTPELVGLGQRLAAQNDDDQQRKILHINEIELERYDPALTRMIREIHYTSFACIRLLRYSSERKIVPYLAETWFLHPDGRTWEFALNQSASFHDGSRITSRDVKFSFERLLNPALGSPYAQLFSVIEGADEYRSGSAREVCGIQTPDDHTVRFCLRASNNFFLSLLALGYSAVIKTDAGYAARPLARDELISAGPFMRASDPDPSIDRLVANPRFVNGRPFIDEIRIRRTGAEPLGELLSGRVDLLYNLTAAGKRSLESQGFRGGFTPYTSRYCYGLVVNFTRNSALSRSPELRRALSMALDKENIINEVLAGAGERADCVIPSSLLDIGGKPFIQYDLAAAKQIIDARRSGISAPIKVAIREYPTIAGLDRLGASVLKTFERLGLDATVDYCPLSKPIGSYRETYDLIFIGFLPEIDLYSAIEPFINPAGGDNYFGYNNPALFQELDGTIGIKDQAERRARFVSILRALTEDAFMIPIFFQQVYCASRQGIHTVYISAEETVMPEILFIEPESDEQTVGHTGDRKKGSPEVTAVLSEYAAAIVALEGESTKVLDGSRALIERSNAIERSIDAQRPAIEGANTQFFAFSKGAERVRAGRQGLGTQITQSSAEASTAADAAKTVGNGLGDMMGTLTVTVKSLVSVLSEVETMLDALTAISASNAFISSISINAAIIAAKSDDGSGELRKVSQSISAQATRNTDYTERLTKTVESMRAAVRAHQEFLSATLSALARSATGVAAAEATMARVLPLLSNVTANGERVAEATLRLGRLVGDERLAVEAITAKADALSQAAETLRFGMDLERAVADILADVGLLNREVQAYTASAGIH
ncbi:MAG: hypothetical protein A2Y38_24760 [Spirochaetes bacterium GWB1_59_5]|nr:MAG: hypothetical protein A2Y38_24760 [Spirochaetes bacterium GWB1_59_5]